MTLPIDVAPELEVRLHERATRDGRDIETVAKALLAWAAEGEAQDDVVISPGSERWQQLERLLAGVTNDNRPGECPTGHAVGGAL